ncbi:2-polyprenyl-6-methoxyphenol hydroxylase-like FAD-dependent oxidoreductase [Nocardia transvalensis]|uniref:2-polyprenyl-6-methoxyphenol hydroxylase-like FAD-dependent oxidoreductase n=1 Tax=Nocardia transvalensis TaxID=37333 RepID=A0A7W9PD87_9NOCA|nr:FAD-dependent oxidoreductase [Nocardia transvalensis]MBB5913508.1 2-polyprenyl-6-methoxyphenol hydroxylase-like FAD-dependent oxidoreductase [Nocardia transvalensis]
MNKSVLISGAGVAGSTAAYWLARNGFRVTVVERAAGERSSGNPVDVRGPAVRIVEDMGVMPRLRAVATAANRLTFADTTGRRRASVGMGAFQSSAGDSEVEVARADLAATLLSAARDHAEIRWGDTITTLSPDAGGVDVTFDRGDQARFDLVIGADGLHSTVRRLAFGPEPEFVRPLGMSVATLRVDRPIGDEREVVMVNTPGRAFSVHPAGGKPLAAFMFRHTAEPAADHRDPDVQKRLVIEAYTGRLGTFERYLDQVRDADDLFFDSVSRVTLPHWSTGPVTLVGDAASSLSLFGDGSTLAIAGAHTLATELAATPADLATALHRYEQRHRALTTPKQRGYTAAATLLVPTNRPTIAIRNTLARFIPS